MENRSFRLRPHHVLNLVVDYKNGYSYYSDRDKDSSRVFYLTMASDPNNSIAVVSGIDDVCKLCSNYDGKRCTALRQSDLTFEDNRTIRDIFPHLKPGDIITVADLMALRKDSLQNPSVLPAPKQ